MTFLLGDERVDMVKRLKGFQTNIPSVLQGKHKHAVSSKAGRSSWDWSSSGGCEAKVLAHEDPLARETELRELREKVEWHEGAERKQGTQGEPAGAQGSVEEDGKDGSG